MKVNHLAAKVLLLVAMSWAITSAPGAARAEKKPAATAKKKPAAAADRVVACYFHRTQRCPTCKKISAYTEEAIRGGFAREIKARKVAFHMIDFQDPNSAKYTKYYKITGPTLIVMDVRDSKVTRWKPLPKVWSLVFKKDDFLKYVRDEVRGYVEKP